MQQVVCFDLGWKNLSPYANTFAIARYFFRVVLPNRLIMINRI